MDKDCPPSKHGPRYLTRGRHGRGRMTRSSRKKKEKLPQWPARNFCFNFPTEFVKRKAFEERLKDALNRAHFIRYVVVQREPYGSGKYHYQGYCETTGPQKASRVLRWLSPTNAWRINIDKRYKRGSRSDARYYCMKDADGKYNEDFDWPGHKGRDAGTKPLEYGHWKPDINSRKVAIKRLNSVIEKADSWSEVMNSDEIASTLKGAMHYAKARYKSKPAKKQEGLVLRPWQEQLEVELLGTPDPRKVVWIVDPKGGLGKTFMTKYFVTNHGAIMLDGKNADMYYGYDGQRIVIMDLARSRQNFHNYSGMEKIKDGIFYNTKYDSGMYMREYDCHMVVFSNWLPDQNQLSADRWDIRMLQENEVFGDIELRTISSCDPMNTATPWGSDYGDRNAGRQFFDHRAYESPRE